MASSRRERREDAWFDCSSYFVGEVSASKGVIFLVFFAMVICIEARFFCSESICLHFPRLVKNANRRTH